MSGLGNRRSAVRCWNSSSCSCSRLRKTRPRPRRAWKSPHRRAWQFSPSRAASRIAGRCPATCRASDGLSVAARLVVLQRFAAQARPGRDDSLELVPLVEGDPPHARSTPAAAASRSRNRGAVSSIAHVLCRKYGMHLPSIVRPWPSPAKASARRLHLCRLGAAPATFIRSSDPGPCPSGQASPRQRHGGAVLDVGKARTGWLWTYVRDDRPFAGSDPPAAIYVFSPDRTSAHPEWHLARMAGAHARPTPTAATTG